MADRAASGRADTPAEPPAPADLFMLRLEAVRERFRMHAGNGAKDARLTAPDPTTGERWDAGQVWAHLVEFPGYWLGQLRTLVTAHAEGAREPTPFGRTSTDPGRIAPIEAERRKDPTQLHARLDEEIAQVEAVLRAMQPADWLATGVHPKRGAMSMPEIVERFLVGHLEEHATQLGELGAAAAG